MEDLKTLRESRQLLAEVLAAVDPAALLDAVALVAAENETPVDVLVEDLEEASPVQLFDEEEEEEDEP